MRSKSISSAAAFIVAFAASAAFASLFVTNAPQTASVVVETSDYKPTSCFAKYRNNSAAADKISALIRQDHVNGRESREELRRLYGDKRPPFSSSFFPVYAESVERYVDASSAMKVSDQPGDFETEWREHMKAWRAYSKFLNKVKDTPKSKNWTDEELEEVDDFHSREIKRTWETVLHVGATHGADVY